MQRRTCCLEPMRNWSTGSVSANSYENLTLRHTYKDNHKRTHTHARAHTHTLVFGLPTLYLCDNWMEQAKAKRESQAHAPSLSPIAPFFGTHPPILPPFSLPQYPSIITSWRR